MKASQFFIFLMLSVLVLFTSYCTKTAEATNGTPGFNTANNKKVGASARELLSADKPSLVLEVNYMRGYALQPTTLTALTNFLSAYTNKGAFQVIQKEIPASGKDTLSMEEIDKIERQNRTSFNSSNEVSVYILVTDGKYNITNTIGFSYRNTSITLFGKTIQSFSGGINQVPRSKLEASTLEHEFGHLLGLLDVGSPMQIHHKDAANPQHCSNSKCLMYYKTETMQMLGTLIKNSIPILDADCHNDLIANGGK